MGIILSAVGTAPYTSTILPVPLVGALIGGACIVALVVAHIFSNMKKNSIQQDLNDYATHIGIEWNEVNYNTKWTDLKNLRDQHIEQKRRELASNNQALFFFNKRLEELTKAIEPNIFADVPVKYIVGWQANNTRNSVGYLFAGVGIVTITVTSIFLRIFVL